MKVATSFYSCDSEEANGIIDEDDDDDDDDDDNDDDDEAVGVRHA